MEDSRLAFKLIWIFKTTPWESMQVLFYHAWFKKRKKKRKKEREKKKNRMRSQPFIYRHL